MTRRRMVRQRPRRRVSTMSRYRRETDPCPAVRRRRPRCFFVLVILHNLCRQFCQHVLFPMFLITCNMQKEGASATTTPLGPLPARGKSQERQLHGRSFSRHEAIARYLPEGLEVGQAAVAPTSASRGDGPISTFWCVCVDCLWWSGGRAKREREKGSGREGERDGEEQKDRVREKVPVRALSVCVCV